MRPRRTTACSASGSTPTRSAPAGLGAEPTYAFCMAIVEATADLACAFKPNMAFFEALGPSGPATLQRLIAGMPRTVPVLVDAKRGDIGSTAAAYAQAIFGWLGADAVTLSPYLGGDALAPFHRLRRQGCFVLCKTSNPGSADLQDLQAASGEPRHGRGASAQHEVERQPQRRAGGWRHLPGCWRVCGRQRPTCRCWCRGLARRAAS
ncbi:MAG: orotidine-5'-phosphate decarboxylase [Kouleothrix sp.]